MKILKLLLATGIIIAMSSCTSYKNHVAAGYNPNNTENIYHLVHE
ncbi:hypothetical protein FHS70_002259 [Flammeovirga yaeyamensis]|nr:hypothetical protein [Flammeovirga yaeyamensis]